MLNILQADVWEIPSDVKQFAGRVFKAGFVFAVLIIFY